MSDFSSLTHKFRANLDNQPAGGANKVTKRNRQPLSCAPCRIKKLKCDRGHPCETCVKRGDEASCNYGKTASTKSSDPLSNSGNISNGRGRAQERLRQLEQLVLQIVDNPNAQKLTPQSSRANTDSPSDNSDTAPTSSIAKEGHLQYGSSESRYVGSTHWSAIMENIQELKSALSSNTEGGDQPFSTELDDSEDVETQDADNLFGSTSHLSISQILSQALPPRLQVDRRLSTYFNSRYLVIPFIHTQQFQRQYEQFWETPLETSPLWISILFSICCLSAGLSEAVGSEPSTPEDQPRPRVTFLHAACQSLRLGGFTRPKRFVVEALGLYSQCKYMSTLDPSGSDGTIFSIVVRLAYRSGYHRDPSQFPHISVFEGEMRRRAWAMCRQFDLMVSFQLGLPNQIPPDSWDTRNPLNLLDTDLQEDMKELPPSRPEEEATQILYFVVKSRLMTTFGKICAHALSFSCSDDCSQLVMELDKEVRATYATVPKVLHIKPMSQSFADPSYLTMVRTNCEFLYQKSLLVLHRKYMTQGNHPASVKACTDAAMAITRHMLDLNKEFKPGGQLFHDRWMLSSFTMNDFYLAGMILCLGVSTWKKAHPGKDVNQDERMREQLTMLQDSFQICEDLSPTSHEAKRVAGVVRAVLGSQSERSTPASLTHVPPSAVQSENPFHQPGNFQMPSAMFPMQYDFNLAPLTLQEKEHGPNLNSTSEESSYQMPQREDQIDTGGSFAMNHSNSNGNSTSSNFQNLMPGIGNPTSSGPNAFMNFFPFSPAYGSQTPASESTQQPQSSNSAETQNFNTPLNSMDVDWPLLDQWMAFPEPNDITPWSDESMAAPLRSALSDQRAIDGGYPSLDESRAMTGTVEDPAAGWASNPFLFLGHEAHARLKEQARGASEATIGGNVSGNFVSGIMNLQDVRAASRATGRYPQY